ncbi:MAG: DUF1659 domain-containing protein [Desulfitobacterium sp.]
MAILSTPLETAMVVRYQIGIVDGSPVIRQKRAEIAYIFVFTP